MVGQAIQFNKKGNKVIYIANEKEKMKEEGFFRNEEEEEEEDWQKKLAEGLKRREYKGDLGEQMVGITGGHMFIWDMESNGLEEVVINSGDEKVFPMNAQLVEVGGSEGVLFCGY